MKLTIELSDDEVKVLKKRADKNLLQIKEMVEDIVRRSCVNYKTTSNTKIKCDDRLVEIFSREKRRR